MAWPRTPNNGASLPQAKITETMNQSGFSSSLLFLSQIIVTEENPTNTQYIQKDTFP